MCQLQRWVKTAGSVEVGYQAAVKPPPEGPSRPPSCRFGPRILDCQHPKLLPLDWHLFGMVYPAGALKSDCTTPRTHKYVANAASQETV